MDSEAAISGCNRITDHLNGLNSREIKDGFLLIFSDETHGELSKRLFDGVSQETKALLIRIADTASSPK
jgi:hypothetical protein